MKGPKVTNNSLISTSRVTVMPTQLSKCFLLLFSEQYYCHLSSPFFRTIATSLIVHVVHTVSHFECVPLMNKKKKKEDTQQQWKGWPLNRSSLPQKDCLYTVEYKSHKWRHLEGKDEANCTCWLSDTTRFHWTVVDSVFYKVSSANHFSDMRCFNLWWTVVVRM